MTKLVCILALFFSMTALAETSPEVLEAEKLIQTSTAAVVPAVVAASTTDQTEMKEPIVPAVNENEYKAGTERISDKKENEIPVQLESTKKAGSDHSLYFKAIFSLLVVFGMGVGSYILIGRYRRANLTKNPATQIKVLTQYHLGPKKSLAIVRVAGESILIGITDQNISMLKSLALLDEDIPEETPSHFASIFAAKNNQQIAMAADEAQRSSNANSSARQDDEEFSISGIKDFVSTRLKNMRTLE